MAHNRAWRALATLAMSLASAGPSRPTEVRNVTDVPAPSRSVLAAHLDGESVLLEMKRKRYYRLNETGQVIWRALEAGRSYRAVVAELIDTFEVDETSAQAELARFVAELSDAGLLEPQDT